MLDEELTELAERSIRLELEPRDAALRSEVESQERMMAPLDGLGQSRYAESIRSMFTRELRRRADIVSNAYLDVVAASRIAWDESLRNGVFGRVTALLDAEAPRLEEQARQAIAPHGHSFFLFLTEAKAGIADRIAADLDLVALRRRPRQHALSVELQAPRYSGPLDHWNRSEAAQNAADPDYIGATREAVAAVEAMAKIVVAAPNGTLGDCIKILRGTGRLSSAVLKTLESVWAFANTTPGVRHGAYVSPDISESEARFIITCCEAAVRLLLEKDVQ